MENQTSTIAVEPQGKASWKPLWWLIGIASAVTLLSLAYWFGRIHLFPNLHPTRDVFEQEISFEKPGSYSFTAELPWKGQYSLWFRISGDKHTCDPAYRRKVIGDISYDREEKLLHRGIDWPFSWTIHNDKDQVHQGKYTRDLFIEKKESGSVTGGCWGYRKFAVLGQVDSGSILNINLNVDKAVSVPIGTKTFVKLRLDKPASSFVQLLFLAMPALDLYTALLWRGYRILWLWGVVALVGLLMFGRQRFHSDDTMNTNHKEG